MIMDQLSPSSSRPPGRTTVCRPTPGSHRIGTGLVPAPPTFLGGRYATVAAGTGRLRRLPGRRGR